jgi:hypothetical protein
MVVDAAAPIHAGVTQGLLSTTCEQCGRAPVQRFKVRRHVAMVTRMKVIQVEPVLCRECATKLLVDFTKRTLVQGWWGPISLFVANPATILLNLLNLVKARRMPPPSTLEVAAAPFGARASS